MGWRAKEFRKKDGQKEKPSRYFTKEKKNKDMFLKGNKDERKLGARKPERTKDCNRELGGMERSHKKIRYGRRDSEEPQFHSGVSAVGLCCFGITRSASLDCTLVLLLREPCACFI